MKRASVFPIFVATSLLLLVVAATAPFAFGAPQSKVTAANQGVRQAARAASNVIDLRRADLLAQVTPALRGVALYVDDQFQGITSSEGRLLVSLRGGITVGKHPWHLDINGKQCMQGSFLLAPKYQRQTVYYTKGTLNFGLPDSCTTATATEHVLASAPSGDPQQAPSGQSADSGPSLQETLNWLQGKIRSNAKYTHCGVDWAKPATSLSGRLADAKTLNRDILLKKVKGEIPEEDFAVLKEHVNQQMTEAQAALNALDSEASTVENLIQEAQRDLVDLVKAWRNGSVQQRQEMAFRLYPEGLHWSPETAYFEPHNTLLMLSFEEMIAEIKAEKNIGGPTRI
jgi:hypothetical protein